MLTSSPVAGAWPTQARRPASQMSVVASMNARQGAWGPVHRPSSATPQQPLPAGQCSSSASSMLRSSSSRRRAQAPATSRGLDRSWRSHASASSAPGGGDIGGTGGGSGGSGGGGGGGGDGENSDDEEILDLQQVEAAAGAAKVQLPADMLETAKQYGIRASALSSYFTLQAAGLTGKAARNVPWIRDRLIADNKFLFKVVVECIIDSGCATVAEVRKRGDDFWQEFEFYLSDLLVGIVLDVALVSLMAPAAVLGSRRAVGSGALSKWLATVPSAVFAASVPGVVKFTAAQRLACILVKFCEYSLAGMACGFVGQGIANSLMLLKRRIHGTSEHDVAVPPLLGTAAVWGLFMGVSSNLRYQAVYGVERLVDLTIAKRVPAIAYGTTVAVRFANNVVGGEQFIDLARFAGVQ